MDYLNHLGRVIDKENRKKDIANLEQELGYQVPKMLKSFYLMYQVNDLKKYKKGRHIDYNFLVWNSTRNYFSNMTLFVSEYKELGFDPQSFFEFSVIKRIVKDIFNDDYGLYETNYIFIAETSWHFPLMIGINNDGFAGFRVETC